MCGYHFTDQAGMNGLWDEGMYRLQVPGSGAVSGLELENPTKYPFEASACSPGIKVNSQPRHDSAIVMTTVPMNALPQFCQIIAGMNVSATHGENDIAVQSALSAGLSHFGAIDSQYVSQYLEELEDGSGAISTMIVSRAPTPLDNTPALSTGSTSSEPNSDIPDGVALNATLGLGFDTCQALDGDGFNRGSGANRDMSEPPLSWIEWHYDVDKPFALDTSTFSNDRTPMPSSQRTKLPAPGEKPGDGPPSQFLSNSDAMAESNPDGLPPTTTAPSHVGNDSIRSGSANASSDVAMICIKESIPAEVPQSPIEISLETYTGQVPMDNSRATVISSAGSEYGSRFSQDSLSKARSGCLNNIHSPVLSLSDKACQSSCEKVEAEPQTDTTNRLWDLSEPAEFRASSEASQKTSPPWPLSPRSNSSVSSSTTDLESPLSSDDNGSDITIAEEQIPTYLVQVIVRNLLETFFCVYSTVGNGPADQEGQKQSAPREQSQTETSNSVKIRPPKNQEATNSKKRKYINDSDERPGDDDGDDEDEDHPRKRVTFPKDLSSNTLYACPFSKWKPLSYQSCYKYIMNDISRVKQHLNRKHQRPFCCPTCSDVFHELDEFYGHVDERTCTKKPKVEIEGITPSQKKVLEQRSDKRQSKEEQWYTIYSVIFPGSPRPVTPYVEGNLSSELLSFQRFMSREGPEIIERTVNTYMPEGLFPQHDAILSLAQTLFQHAIPEVLQRYERTRPSNNSPDSGYASLGFERLATAVKLQNGARVVDDIVQSISMTQAADVGPQQPATSPEKRSNQPLENSASLGDLREAKPETGMDTELLQDLAANIDTSFEEELKWDSNMPFGTEASGIGNFDFSLELKDIFTMELGHADVDY